jgi:hypothetical protein
MQTCWLSRSWHVVPVGHEFGSATVQRRRQKPLMHESPLRQMASIVPVALQASFASLISVAAQAQMPPFTVGRHAAHAPGFDGLHDARQKPPRHCAPPAHGIAELQA